MGKATGPRVCPHNTGTYDEVVMENGRVAYVHKRCNECNMILRTEKR